MTSINKFCLKCSTCDISVDLALVALHIRLWVAGINVSVDCTEILIELIVLLHSTWIICSMALYLSKAVDTNECFCALMHYTNCCTTVIAFCVMRLLVAGINALSML